MTISVTNTTDKVKFLEVDSLLWTQEDNKEVETPTEDFIIFPKTFKLKAGQTKKVQLKPRDEAPEEIEKSYRLLFREIQSEKEKETAGVHVVVNIKCALYRKPKKPEPFQSISCRLDPKEDDNGVICTNPNKENVLLREIVFLKDSKEDKKSVGLSVHPGKDKRVSLKGALEMKPEEIVRVEYNFRGEGKEFRMIEGSDAPQDVASSEKPAPDNPKSEG